MYSVCGYFDLHADNRRTEVGSFELTIPAMVKTTTEVSMVTVTQVSVQTTTVSALTTVSGLCAATSVSSLSSELLQFSLSAGTGLNPRNILRGTGL